MPADDLSAAAVWEAAAGTLDGCPPAAWPRRRAVVALPVDDSLTWVLRRGGRAAGTAFPATPEVRGQLEAVLDEEATDDSAEAQAFARLVFAAFLSVCAAQPGDGLPDLPYLGKPFGGEEGTD